MASFRKDLSITLIGSVISAVCNIMWLAIISRKFGVEQYGIYIICQNLGIFIATFANIRMSDLIYKYHNGGVDDYSNVKVFSYVVTIIVSVIITFSCYILLDYVSNNIYSNVPILMLKLAVIYVFFHCFNNISLAILRCSGKFDLIVKIDSTFKIAQLVIGGYLIALTDYIDSVEYVFLIWFVFNTMIQIVLIVYSILDVNFNTSFKNIVKFLKVNGKDIYIITFHSNLLGYFKIATSPGDTFLIGLFSGPMQVAMYNVALQVINLGVLIKNNLTNVLTPKLIAMASENKEKLHSFIMRYFYYSSMFSLLFIVVVYFFGSLVIEFIFGVQPSEFHTLLLLMTLNFCLTLISLCYYPLALSRSELKARTVVLTIKIFVLFSYIILFDLTAISFVAIELFFTLVIRIVNDYPLHRKVFCD